jgi:hypothetical protein
MGDSSIMATISGSFVITLRRQNREPVWSFGPEGMTLPEAIGGVPQRWNVREFVSDPDGDPITLALFSISPELAALGFSFDSQSGDIVYDGTPLPDAASDLIQGNVRISADDGRP